MAELTCWKDPGLPVAVDFAPETMEQIRRLGVDGLMSLRRVGVGVGGLLLGKYEGGRVTVLGVAEIACAHTFGPSFRLTPEEIVAAFALGKATDGERVVGFFCAKPRGTTEPGEEDRKLFDLFCPEAWQAMLLICPNSNGPSAGAVYARGRGGALAGGTRLPIEKSDAVAVAVEPVAVEIEDEPEIPPPLPAEPVRPAMARPEIPLFAPVAPLRRAWFEGAWPKWAGAAVLLVIVFAAAILSRDLWMPRPKVDLRSYDSDGRLIIEWNRSAVRDIDSGSLLVNDGDESRTIVLSGAELHSGTFRYDRKTGRVSVILRAGPVQDRTTFKELPATLPVPSQPGQP